MSCGEKVEPSKTIPRGPRTQAEAFGPTAEEDGTTVEELDDSYVPRQVSYGVNVGKWFEPSEDLHHGQVVVIAARWILVGAGLMLALWNPDAVGELKVQLMLILGLAVANFFLHSRVLMGQRVMPAVAYMASAVDIGVISMIVVAAGGFESGAYVFYFPALLALSVAYRTEVTFVFTGAAVALYGLIASAGMVGAEDGATVVARLLILAAVAVCGNVYYRTERDRRKAAEQTREELKIQLQQEVSVS
jgi:hypothetical protein